ncbi:hypothetical protein [Frankia sp. AgPm24]|uniref:hypothetical protein n=1 Tax=Frankia sp. AgPm24 TaxID=631128 RepID=UPI0035B02346
MAGCSSIRCGYAVSRGRWERRRRHFAPVPGRWSERRPSPRGWPGSPGSPSSSCAWRLRSTPRRVP